MSCYDDDGWLFWGVVVYLAASVTLSAFGFDWPLILLGIFMIVMFLHYLTVEAIIPSIRQARKVILKAFRSTDL